MASLHLGETVICFIETRDDAETLKDPTTSISISIAQVQPVYKVVLTSSPLVKDSVGKYHYDFQTIGLAEGTYEIIYTAVDGTRVKIEKDRFVLR